MKNKIRWLPLFGKKGKEGLVKRTGKVILFLAVTILLFVCLDLLLSVANNLTGGVL